MGTVSGRIFWCGLTEIEIGNEIVEIRHRGNMSNTESVIAENVKCILSGDYFSALRDCGWFYNDGVNIHDDPAYSWVLRIDRADFDVIVGA